MTDTITMLRIDALHESPFNPRKIFDEAALKELSTDIAAQGRVLSPLLVRPRIPPLFARHAALEADPNAIAGHEIVFGHRRYRAAALAGLVEVPCMVRAMTDDEARRTQISENLQRKDVHPIEEAEGFQALIDNDNETADTIAEKFGKSRSYVYGRLKLLQACPPIRKACLAGEIDAEVSLLIARLRTPKLQEKALGYIQGKCYDLKDAGKRSYRNVRDLLNERFALDLKDAIFDPEAEMLLPIAGSCVRCPKRSSNAPEYEDVLYAEKPGQWSRLKAGANVCTDPDCFDAKKKAHLKLEAGKLSTKGEHVVDGNKARQAINATGQVGGGYIALKDASELVAKARANARADSKVVPPLIVTIQDPRTGKTQKAVKLAELKAAGVKVAEPKNSNAANERDRQKREAEHLREEARRKAEAALHLQLLERVRAAAAATERSAFDLQLVAHTAYDGVDWHDQPLLAELYGHKTRDQLAGKIGQMSTAQLTLFVLDCALVANVRREYSSGKPTPLLLAAKHYGIDIEALRAGGAETAPTPSVAARAAKGAKAAPAAAGAKKAKAKTAKGSPSGIEQKDDAGVAGGSDQADLLSDAEVVA